MCQTMQTATYSSESSEFLGQKNIYCPNLANMDSPTFLFAMTFQKFPDFARFPGQSGHPVYLFANSNLLNMITIHLYQNFCGPF